MADDTTTTARFAGSGGVTLVGDVAGPEAGTPVVFLHGGGQTRHSWKGALRQAARRGYRAISLDLRGHGESDWSPGGVYDIACFADDLRQVASVLPSPPAVVGASLGGIAALTVAGSPPPRLSALVLVDVAVKLEPAGTQEIGAFMTSAPDGFASLDEAADAVAAFLPHRPRPSDTSGLLRNLRQGEDGRLRWHWDPAMIRPTGRTGARAPHALEDAASALDLPVLLIRGGLSRVLSKAGVDHFRTLVPAAEFVDVAGADHMVAGDANDAFNTAVFDFLARNVPPAASHPQGSI